MAKFSRFSKLSAKERQKIMIEFCDCLSTLKSGEEAAKFLTDLLGPQEAEMLAKRLKIAELLLAGKNYQTIREQVKASFATIARVNTWLNLSGEGFKIVLSRKPKPKYTTPSEEERYDSFSWYNLKRRYSAYFWPQLLIEELLKQSDENHRKKITSILQSIRNKSETKKEQIFMKENSKHTAIIRRPSYRPKPPPDMKGMVRTTPEADGSGDLEIYFGETFLGLFNPDKDKYIFKNGHWVKEE
jgi:TrpR-related protein YerC/YecD